MNTYLIFVVTSVLVGAACAFIAYRTQRDPLRWFLIGLILNIVALAIIVAVASRENSHAARTRS